MTRDLISNLARDARRALTAFATLIASCATASTGTAQIAPDTGRFTEEIRAFEQRDRQQMPPANAVLFVGSSSIRMWCMLALDFPSVQTINRGFGGSEMHEVVRYAERIVLPYRPRTVVVYAGDNDLMAGKTPAQVQEAYREFATLVQTRLPDTKLVYLAIKPSPARAALLPKVRATNALLRDEARRDPRRVTFVDVYTPMLGASGRPRRDLFGADSLHMNSAGYALWRATLAPVLTSDRRAGAVR